MTTINMLRLSMLSDGASKIFSMLRKKKHSGRAEQGIGIRQKLNQVASSVFAGTPVLFAYLYGSFAKGATHPFSDLDVGVFIEGLDTRACLNLELSLALRIDESLDHMVQSEVRVINHLPLVVKGRILTDGVLIYSRAEHPRIEFETRTRKLYFDFLPVIFQHQNAYREKLLSVQS